MWECETHRLLQLWLWLPHLQSGVLGGGHTTFHFRVTIPPGHSETTGTSVFLEATAGFKVAVNLDCMEELSGVGCSSCLPSGFYMAVANRGPLTSPHFYILTQSPGHHPPLSCLCN